MPRMLKFLTLTAVLLPVAVGAQPTATVLLKNNVDLPGGPAGNPVTSITTPAANHGGGYCFGVVTTGTEGTISRFWGNAIDGPGALIRSEGTIGIFEQTAFETFYGFSNEGEVAYSPTCNNLDSGSTGLDSVWYGDFPIAVEEEVIPHLEGWFWRFASRPGTTGDGIPYFVGGITSVQGGSTQNRGLFYGWDGAPVLLGGDMVDGLDQPLDTGTAVTFDFRYSAYGTHYIAPVVTTGPTATNRHVVIDGAVILIDGMPVSRGSPVPAAAGGLPGENWENFDSMGITESGYYMFTGDTSGPTATDEFVVVNGMIVLREGDLVGGYPLAGAIERAYMNNNGDWAVAWFVNDGGTNREVLIFNGDIMLKRDDLVDFDGDGVPDPGHTLTDMTGIAALAVGDRQPDGRAAVYFVADLTVPDFVAVDSLPGEIVDPEAAGRTEPDSEPARGTVRAGLVVRSEAVVPVLLSGFEVVAAQSGADLSWVAYGAMPGEFELIAQRGAQSWPVAFTTDGAGRYHAHDLLANGTVTYSLYLRNGSQTVLLESKTIELAVPAAGLQLLGAFPNPFNPQTNVVFAVGRAQQVHVAVHGLDGRLVTVLADRVFPSGRHQTAWDGCDQAGRPVPSGTYLARIQGADGTQTGKLMLVK
ncbi:MAG: T9SS type A sorting domain-containing protein [Candidatus Krumholzibacteria bacterium]|nr:T9SS type A sorting domain-containing protein [Candidatus Krumholzibacteria bacterium]